MRKHETRAPLAVIGTGEMLDGGHVYIVPSQTEAGRVHLVRQLPTRLQCDCRAFHYRGKCAHVEAVKAHKAALLLAEVDETRAQLQTVRRDLAHVNAAAQTSAQTSAQDTRPAYFGGRSQAAFSLMK